MLRKLSVAVHVFVILLVIARSNFANPFAVFQIPQNGFLYSHGKRGLGIPAQVFFYLCRVNGVTQVVPQTVGYVGYQVVVNPRQVVAFDQQTAELRTLLHCAANDVYYQVHDVNVFLLVVPAYIIYTAVRCLVDHQVYRFAVVVYVQPVSYVQTFAIYRKFLAFKYVVDD